jgi:hypothetical protein
MQAMLARQKAAGSNVVWIGHNNPGEVDAKANEPGLSYAVFEALQDESDPRNADAQAILAAQERILQAARALGMQVVLPVGYQSQMGSTWDATHEDSLRRGARGGINRDTAVVNASFYSPAYRRDIRRYYEWVDRRLVKPNRDVILMVNMADEPSGGDYSAAADVEFFARYGYSFVDVGDDPARQTQLGAFQSNYIAEYAAWSAEQWAALEPDLPTTMSFEGATARIHLQLPRVESLFARTPPTFYPTFDAYPRDGPPEAAIDDASLSGLFLLVRSLGYYSARYQRPFWLWSAANSWGLAQASPQPANVADAVANAYYLALLARQTGGLLQGVAVWSYNTYGQGLYNDVHKTVYNPDVMFAAVSAALPQVREQLAQPAGQAQVLVLAPDSYAYRLLGARPATTVWDFRSYDFDRLRALTRNNVAAAIVSDLGDVDLTAVRAVLVLARAPDDLDALTTARLRDFAAAGRAVVASATLASSLGARVHYVEHGAPEAAFGDSPSETERALWREALGVDAATQGYVIATGEAALLYSIAPEPKAVRASLGYAAQGYLADSDGEPRKALATNGHPLDLELSLGQFAYLRRVDTAAPPFAGVSGR